jgi:hypothetical protein
MRRLSSGLLTPLAALVLLGGCTETTGVWVGGEEPAPPLSLQGWYYDRAIHLSWELHARWDEEPFRVYGRRSTDRSHFLVAEVTSCNGGLCTYTDLNVTPGRTYEYYVAAVNPRSGIETASAHAVEVHVPQPVPPPVPGGLEAVALDRAVYLQWDLRSRDAGDFAFYRVYIEGGDGTVLLLGETDSEGFLDLLVENGKTYGYFVTAVDDQGHESGGSALAEATPRPDFHGELLWAHEDRPAFSGFRFQEDEGLDPIRSGTATDRHFRLEVDGSGWWLVPAPGVQVHSTPFPASALKCGPAADAGCTDVRVAPTSGYSSQDAALSPGYAWVLRVPGPGGEWRYGVVRITHVGFAQEGALILFDWAFQLQPGNRALSPSAGPAHPMVDGPGS